VAIPELTTRRLLLRGWRPSDREPFAALNADPEVMRYLSKRLSREESDAFIERITAGWAERGHGLWAVERRSDRAFLGFTGLAWHDFEAPFTPAVEIGWRFGREAWGHGYATEAAAAALAFAFEDLGLDQILSWTTVDNVASQRVMQRIGMHHDPADDFDHPRLPDGHPLRRHVLYRLGRGEWERRTRGV
jgi:RimJ/RimL family protein N-acetyltransferase